MVSHEAIATMAIAIVGLIAWLARIGHQTTTNEKNIAILFEKAASQEVKIMDELIKLREDVALIKGFLRSKNQ